MHLGQHPAHNQVCARARPIERVDVPCDSRQPERFSLLHNSAIKITVGWPPEPDACIRPEDTMEGIDRRAQLKLALGRGEACHHWVIPGMHAESEAVVPL